MHILVKATYLVAVSVFQFKFNRSEHIFLEYAMKLPSLTSENHCMNNIAFKILHTYPYFDVTDIGSNSFHTRCELICTIY